MCPGVFGASTARGSISSSCFFSRRDEKDARQTRFMAHVPPCGPRYDDDEHDDEHDDDDDDDTSGRTTPENEVRASTMRHGKYRPVYRVEAAMRSEGTGTATTGSSHRQRRIAVEP